MLKTIFSFFKRPKLTKFEGKYWTNKEDDFGLYPFEVMAKNRGDAILKLKKQNDKFLGVFYIRSKDV